MPVSHFHDLVAHVVGADHSPAKIEALERMRQAPKFVFSEDVMVFLDHYHNDYQEALVAAAAAGHTELPHNPMVVEYGRGGGGGMRDYWLIEQTELGHFLLTAALDYPEVNRVRGGPMIFKPLACSITANGIDGLPRSPRGQRKPTDIKSTLWLSGRMSLFLAMALHVRGIITLPARPVDPKLQQARARRRLPPITKDFVTVHIGYVTGRDGERHQYTEGLGHHVRVHLRRGHTRNQPCGPGLQDRKEIWIPSVLVNYRPGAVVEDVDYLVVP